MRDSRLRPTDRGRPAGTRRLARGATGYAHDMDRDMFDASGTFGTFGTFGTVRGPGPVQGITKRGGGYARSRSTRVPLVACDPGALAGLGDLARGDSSGGGS